MREGIVGVDGEDGGEKGWGHGDWNGVGDRRGSESERRKGRGW